MTNIFCNLGELTLVVHSIIDLHLVKHAEVGRKSSLSCYFIFLLIVSRSEFLWTRICRSDGDNFLKVTANSRP